MRVTLRGRTELLKSPINPNQLTLNLADYQELLLERVVTKLLKKFSLPGRDVLAAR